MGLDAHKNTQPGNNKKAYIKCYNANILNIF